MNLTLTLNPSPKAFAGGGKSAKQMIRQGDVLLIPSPKAFAGGGKSATKGAL